jgi:outer membrane protein TolC
MKIFIFLIFISFNAPASEGLSVTQFINKAIDNDPGYQDIILERMKKDYLVDIGLPTRQFLLSIRNEYGFNQGESITTNRLTTSLRKDFTETGTQLTFSRLSNVLPDREEEVYEARINQSLLNNSFGKRTRLLKKSLEKESNVIELQVVEAYEDYVANLFNEYLDFFLAFKQYQTSVSQYRESRNLRKNILERKKANIALQLDLDRAELELAQTELNLEESTFNYNSRVESIRRLTGLKIKQLVPDSNLGLDSFYSKMEQFKLGFYKESRKAQITKLQHSASGDQLSAQEDLFGPKLDLILGYNIDESVRFGVNVSRQEAVVGVLLEVPFGDSRTRAVVEEAKFQELKTSYAKKIFKQSTDIMINLVKLQVDFQKKVLDITQKQVLLSKKIQKAEEIRYQRGRIDLEVVIRARNDSFQSDYRYHQNLVSYYKSLVNWLNLTDKLVTNFAQSKMQI